MVVAFGAEQTSTDLESEVWVRLIFLHIFEIFEVAGLSLVELTLTTSLLRTSLASEVGVQLIFLLFWVVVLAVLPVVPEVRAVSLNFRPVAFGALSIHHHLFYLFNNKRDRTYLLSSTYFSYGMLSLYRDIRNFNNTPFTRFAVFSGS